MRNRRSHKLPPISYKSSFGAGIIIKVSAEGSGRPAETAARQREPLNRNEAYFANNCDVINTPPLAA